MKQYTFTLLFILSSQMVFAQYDRDTTWVKDSSNVYNFDLTFTPDFVIEGDYHAIIVGVQDYEENDLDLVHPVKDAIRLKDMLVTFYNFKEDNVTFLENPKRSELINKLDQLASKVKAEDQVLIFYAGHGKWNPNSETGYWLLADAKDRDNSTWYSNSELRDKIRAINARHILLITDACFSGGLLRGEDAGGKAILSQLNKNKSRRAMTSGSLKTVPDKSVFIDYLVRRLGENTNKYLPTDRLYYSFRKNVTYEVEGQTPRYGRINDAGQDNGGEFIFTKVGQ